MDLIITMGNIHVKKKKNVYTFINIIKYPETINKAVLQRINANVYDYFFPVEVIEKKKKAQLKCTVEGLVTLKSYIEKGLSKESFLDIVLQICLIIKLCKDEYINSNNIELNANRIFIIPNANVVRCIYWPVVNNKYYVKPNDFFRNLVDEINFTQSQNTRFLQTYNTFFNDLTPFSINSFEKMILELQGLEFKKNNTIFESSAPSHQGETSNTLICSNHRTKNHIKNVEYDPFDDLSNMTAATRIEIDSLETSDYKSVNKWPQLIRCLTNDNVCITASVFKIGKNINETQYTIKNNPAISRIHAMIVYKNNCYYIKDNNSTNKTYLNGSVLKPNTEYQLSDGDKIRLANEDFIFRTQRK